MLLVGARLWEARPRDGLGQRAALLYRRSQARAEESAGSPPEAQSWAGGPGSLLALGPSPQVAAPTPRGETGGATISETNILTLPVGFSNSMPSHRTRNHLFSLKEAVRASQTTPPQPRPSSCSLWPTLSTYYMSWGHGAGSGTCPQAPTSGQGRSAAI